MTALKEVKISYTALCNYKVTRRVVTKSYTARVTLPERRQRVQA
jgi:hypothetical protein